MRSRSPMNLGSRTLVEPRVMRLQSTQGLGGVALLVAALLAPASSCAMLNNLQLPQGAAGLDITPPSIRFSGATLVQSPSEQLLAAYYCPELVSAPFGTAGMLCQGFFGRRPSPA